jgi:23S rRNA pseudouridine1911/1915/1917 synthase
LGYVNKYLANKKQKALIVHQMDADCSGLVVLAKSALAKDFLQKNWNTFGRTFVCVCHGYLSPMHGVWTTYQDEAGERVKTYGASLKSEGSGKLHLAVTNFRTIETSAGSQDAKYSLVELSLQTNRRDQIRSQFALMNHPIVGDHLYNGGQDNKTGNVRAARLALHASELRFVHPVTRESLTLSSQVPPALTALLGTTIGWNAEQGIGIGNVGDVQGSERGGRDVKVFGLEEWLETSTAIRKN